MREAGKDGVLTGGVEQSWGTKVKEKASENWDYGRIYLL